MPRRLRDLSICPERRQNLLWFLSRILQLNHRRKLQSLSWNSHWIANRSVYYQLYLHAQKHPFKLWGRNVFRKSNRVLMFWNRWELRSLLQHELCSLPCLQNRFFPESKPLRAINLLKPRFQIAKPAILWITQFAWSVVQVTCSSKRTNVFQRIPNYVSISISFTIKLVKPVSTVPTFWRTPNWNALSACN